MSLMGVILESLVKSAQGALLKPVIGIYGLPVMVWLMVGMGAMSLYLLGIK